MAKKAFKATNAYHYQNGDLLYQSVKVGAFREWNDTLTIKIDDMAQSFSAEKMENVTKLEAKIRKMAIELQGAPILTESEYKAVANSTIALYNVISSVKTNDQNLKKIIALNIQCVERLVRYLTTGTETSKVDIIQLIEHDSQYGNKRGQIGRARESFYNLVNKEDVWDKQNGMKILRVIAPVYRTLFTICLNKGLLHSRYIQNTIDGTFKDFK